MSEETSFLDQIFATSPLEWLAVLTGILYVIFAAKKMIVCWLFALASSVIYVFICLQYQLYIESGLQMFYVVMAIIGWFAWRNAKPKASSNDILDNLKKANDDIKLWQLSKHAVNIVASGIIALGLGFLFSRYTDQANPYMDAFTTIYSLAATYMVTQKILENWIYWIVIDVVSIYLYSSRGLQLSAVLYVIFTVLAIFGFVSWLEQFKRQKAE